MIRAPVFPIALEANSIAASTAIPTVANTPLILPNVATAVGGMEYNTTTGEITIPLTGVYSFVMTINPSAGTNTDLYFYSTIDRGSGYVVIPSSGRRVSISGPTEGQVAFASESWFPQPSKLLFHLWSGAPLDAVTQTLPGGAGAYIPAIRLQITGT